MARRSTAWSRYLRINHLLNIHRGEKSVVTTTKLLDELEISLRQLRTDMNNMRLLGAPLLYDGRLRGWRYTAAFDISEPIPLSAGDIMQLKLAVATLAQVNQIPTFQGLTQVFEKIRLSVRRWLHQEATSKAIYFDPIPDYEGNKHLSFMLQAIEESKRICFEYHPFHATVSKGCIFDPYFLRQHNQRWYVGGFSHDPMENFVRTYPLERILANPKFSGSYFQKPKDFHPPDYWKFLVGINRPPKGQIERVVLKFSHLHGRYFVSKPFFEPFSILEETNDHLIIEIEIMIDIELIRRIAAIGSEVQILQPISLVDQMRDFFKKALDIYMP